VIYHIIVNSYCIFYQSTFQLKLGRDVTFFVIFLWGWFHICRNSRINQIFISSTRNINTYIVSISEVKDKMLWCLFVMKTYTCSYEVI